MRNNDVMEEILVSEEEIVKTYKRLAKEITEDYKDKDSLIVLGLLKGCNPFMSDLLCEINLALEIDYMDVSSYYGGLEAQENVQIIRDMTLEVKDKEVIIAEDVVDSGRTVKKVIDLLYSRGAKSVEVVTMIDKPGGRKVELKPKYIGKTLGDEFIVGYGLDYKELFRNVKQIGILSQDVIKELD